MTATAAEIASRHVPPWLQSDLKNDILAYGEALALAAIKAEREACAKIVESHGCVDLTMADGNDDYIYEVHRQSEMILEIAAEIRARNP